MGGLFVEVIKKQRSLEASVFSKGRASRNMRSVHNYKNGKSDNYIAVVALLSPSPPLPKVGTPTKKDIDQNEIRCLKIALYIRVGIQARDLKHRL